MIYSMYQWTVCLEISLMDSVTAQAGGGFGEDKLTDVILR